MGLGRIGLGLPLILDVVDEIGDGAEGRSIVAVFLWRANERGGKRAVLDIIVRGRSTTCRCSESDYVGNTRNVICWAGQVAWFVLVRGGGDGHFGTLIKLFSGPLLG